MKKTRALVVMVCLCIGLTACGQTNAVDFVKNASFAAYPDKPIAQTFQQAFSARGIEAKEEWSDVSDTFSSLLEKDERAVRVQYTVGDEKATLMFTVNTEEQSFALVSIVTGGQSITDADELKDYLKPIFA